MRFLPMGLVGCMLLGFSTWNTASAFTQRKAKAEMNREGFQIQKSSAGGPVELLEGVSPLISRGL